MENVKSAPFDFLTFFSIRVIRVTRGSLFSSAFPIAWIRVIRGLILRLRRSRSG
jgi:hypothetical protein